MNLYKLKSKITIDYTNTMLPLHRLSFTPPCFSLRIGLVFPSKTNNSARFSNGIGFTTEHFWK